MTQSKEIILVLHGGINWTWYCHVILLNAKQCKVVKEYRLHDFDDSQGSSQHPKKLAGNYLVIEKKTKDWNEPRIATGLSISLNNKPEKKYTFINPVPRFNLDKTQDKK